MRGIIKHFIQLKKNIVVIDINYGTILQSVYSFLHIDQNSVRMAKIQILKLEWLNNKDSYESRVYESVDDRSPS